MALDTWLLFFLTSVGMSLSRGPNGLLALTHGALHGSRKTLFTIAGGLAGFTTVIALCLSGIGALLQSSARWLTAATNPKGLLFLSALLPQFVDPQRSLTLRA